MILTAESWHKSVTAAHDSRSESIGLARQMLDRCKLPQQKPSGQCLCNMHQQAAELVCRHQILLLKPELPSGLLAVSCISDISGLQHTSPHMRGVVTCGCPMHAS